MERNCCSSQLPRDCNILRQFSGISLVLFTPDEKFDEQLSCTVLFVSFFYSYFCFTVVSMPSSLNPSIEHSHISSTCLYLKNCRWFFSAPCWYVAFCCCRAATLFLLPTSGLGCSVGRASQRHFSLWWPSEGFLLRKTECSSTEIRDLGNKTDGAFLFVFLVFAPVLPCQPSVYELDS